MTAHPTRDEIADFVTSGSNELIEQHLLACDHCHEVLAEEARADEVMHELGATMTARAPLRRAPRIAVFAAAAALLLVAGGRWLGASPPARSSAPAIALDAGPILASDDSGASQ